MNGNTPLPQTNKGIILVVVLTLAVNATLGVLALAYCLVFKIEPNQVLLTAFISIITGLLGLIGGMLSRTAPSEAIKAAAAAVTHALPITPSNTVPVEVVNPQDEPVPTTETSATSGTE